MSRAMVLLGVVAVCLLVSCGTEPPEYSGGHNFMIQNEEVGFSSATADVHVDDPDYDEKMEAMCEDLAEYHSTQNANLEAVSVIAELGGRPSSDGVYLAYFKDEAAETNHSESLIEDFKCYA